MSTEGSDPMGKAVGSSIFLDCFFFANPGEFVVYLTCKLGDGGGAQMKMENISEHE